VYPTEINRNFLFIFLKEGVYKSVLIIGFNDEVSVSELIAFEIQLKYSYVDPSLLKQNLLYAKYLSCIHLIYIDD